MKAAVFTGPEQIAIRQVDVPEIRPGHVLVDVQACGICGSDLHAYYGEWDQRDVAHGHEFAGVVAEVGEGVEHVRPGDRVCVECFSHCGDCVYCKTGLYNLCLNRRFDAEGHGGFAEYSLVEGKAVFPIPDDMSFEQACLVEPLAVGHRAFHLTEAGGSDTVVVLGAGTIGLCTLAAAVAEGVRQTLITAKHDHQAEMAAALGADHVVRTSDDIRQVVKERTDDLGADAVVDTVALQETVAEALDLPRRKGRVVLVGGFTGPREVDLGKVIHGELIVTGSCCYGYTGMEKGFQTCIGLVHGGQLGLERLITHRYALEEIAEGFRISADKTSGAIKVMICR